MGMGSKYTEHGAYHWDGVYPRHFWRYLPYLHANYQVALRILLRHLPKKKEVRVLDLGCGDGVFLFLLHQWGITDLIGVDLDLIALRLARQQLAARSIDRLTLLCADAYRLPLREECIDGFVALEIIEHLSQPERVLREIARVLRSEGVVVMTTPYAKEGGLQSEHHVHEFTPREIRELLGSFFERVEVYGFRPRWSHSLYQRLGRPGRLVLKIISRYLYNPFTYTVHLQKDEEERRVFEQLVAVGIRKRT